MLFYITGHHVILAFGAPQVIYIYKGQERLKVDGNFKDGFQPLYEWIHDVKPYVYDGKECLVVSA